MGRLLPFLEPWAVAHTSGSAKAPQSRCSGTHTWLLCVNMEVGTHLRLSQSAKEWMLLHTDLAETSSGCGSTKLAAGLDQERDGVLPTASPRKVLVQHFEDR